MRFKRTATVFIAGSLLAMLAATSAAAQTVYWKKDHIHDANGVEIVTATPLPSDQTAPTVPTGLNYSNLRPTSVSLSWAGSSDNVGVAGYKVYRGNLPVAAVGGTTFTDDTLQANTSYTYTVVAFDNAQNHSAASGSVSLTTPDPNLVAAPSGLTATRVSSSQIDLSWTDNSWNETLFKIERKLGAGGNWSQIATVGADSTSYQNVGLSDGTVYYYRVRASNGVNDSVYSNESNACTGTLSGSGTYDGASANISYTGASWTGDPTQYPKAYNSTLHYSRISQDKATFSFTGDNITWAYGKATNLGIANIKIDGIDRGNVDTYAPYSAILWQVAKTWSGLGSGNHTIEITVTGTKNASATDFYVVLDALTVGITTVGNGSYDDQHAQLKFIGSWTRNETFPQAYNSTSSHTTEMENAFTFAFTGTDFTYFSAKAYEHGKAAVTIDGVDYGLVDLYSATDKWQQGTLFSGLAFGIHNVQIAASGQKNPASSDITIDVDRIVVGPAPPSAPSDLSASAISTSQINLFWTDNSSNETGFKVERKTGVGGSWSQIATPGANSTSYPDTGLSPNTTYYYRVRAYNSNGDSGFTYEASATTLGPPVAPSGLTAVKVSNSEIDIYWIDNSNNETGFKIERKLGAGGSWSQIATVGASSTSYQNFGLADGTVYYYRVRAYNGQGDSGYSNEANACTGIISGTVDGNNSNVVYTGSGWFADPNSYPDAYAGTLNYSATAGDKATFSFSGDSVTWFHLRFPNTGIANITIDGINRGNVDQYNSTELWQQRTTYNGLGGGNHTITITVTGTKNANSTDYYVDVDAFLVP